MAKKRRKKPAEGNVGPNGQAAAPSLPPGVKLLRTLEGHQGAVLSVAFDPQGGTLASGGAAILIITEPAGLVGERTASRGGRAVQNRVVVEVTGGSGQSAASRLSGVFSSGTVRFSFFARRGGRFPDLAS